MENGHKKNWKPFAIATGVLTAAFLIVFVISQFVGRNDFNVISEENEETEIQIESISPESEPLESNTADMAETEQTTETVSEELPKIMTVQCGLTDPTRMMRDTENSR